MPASYIDFDADPSGPVAVSEKFVLVYVAEDVQPNTRSEQLLGEALPSGFHLMDVIGNEDPSCTDPIFDCLRPTAGGFMASSIHLELTTDHDSIDFPEWT